jgi:hypothetical protein
MAILNGFRYLQWDIFVKLMPTAGLGISYAGLANGSASGLFLAGNPAGGV